MPALYLSNHDTLSLIPHLHPCTTRTTAPKKLAKLDVVRRKKKREIGASDFWMLKQENTKN
jgi:hypothetical protein